MLVRRQEQANVGVVGSARVVRVRRAVGLADAMLDTDKPLIAFAPGADEVPVSRHDGNVGREVDKTRYWRDVVSVVGVFGD